MSEKRNKDGLTEAEFFDAYKSYDFKKPSLTVDTVLFSVIDEKPAVLLIKRGDHPFIGDYALPGGYVNENETCEDAVKRELAEETGLVNIELEQLVLVSTTGRDKRGWTVSGVFMAVIETAEKVSAGDDASDADWFIIDYVAKGDLYNMILKNEDGSLVLKTEMDIKRDFNGNINLNDSKILSSDGIAFDHAKIILYAIEKL